VALRVEAREPLRKRERALLHRRDDHAPGFRCDANPLIRMQVCGTRHRCGNANAEVVAPVLDVEDCFRHGNRLGLHAFKQSRARGSVNLGERAVLREGARGRREARGS